MFYIVRSGLMGVAWLGAATVFLCSTLQVIALLVRNRQSD